MGPAGGAANYGLHTRKPEMEANWGLRQRAMPTPCRAGGENWQEGSKARRQEGVDRPRSRHMLLHSWPW